FGINVVLKLGLLHHANYIINNDLEYLKGGSSSSKYTTSTTKTKAAKYDDIQGIEDMVQLLWSPVKHDVFTTKRIIAVTHVKVMKWEGDFPRLNMRDIEDMPLFLVQKKLSNLERDDIFDLNVALWMFTRRVVILKQVEDLQLGVKSYQKKLNITKPRHSCPTSPKELQTLHTTTLKELSMWTSTKETS
ncbi:hypothetical protein Tco_1332708, partial [Tanacetum coccineum]